MSKTKTVNFAEVKRAEKKLAYDLLKRKQVLADMKRLYAGE